MNRLLAVLCLLGLSPTLLLLPWALVMALALPLRLPASFVDASQFEAEYAGLSLGTARGLEVLGMFWLYGYFAVIVAYLILAATNSPRLAAVVWRVSTAYFAIIALARPWEKPLWGLTPVPGPQKWAMGITVLLLALSTAGFLLNLYRKVKPSKSGPPPLP